MSDYVRAEYYAGAYGSFRTHLVGPEEKTIIMTAHIFGSIEEAKAFAGLWAKAETDEELDLLWKIGGYADWKRPRS